MKSYIILRQPKAAAPGRLGLDRDRSPPRLDIENVPDHALGELAADSEVLGFAEPMPTSSITPFDAAPAAAAAANWGIAAVGADTSPFTGAGVTVAVLDTGIENTHPAFAGMTLVEEDFSGSGNGDVKGHGTHCAGTIFGRDVGQRIGIARGVQKALIGKVLGNDGKGDTGMILRGLNWALEQKADIVSMSIGFDFPGLVARLIAQGLPADLATSLALESYGDNLRVFDKYMELLAARAAFGPSPLVIAAAGNESRRNIDPTHKIAASLPSAANGVVSVAAMGPGAGKFVAADFSNVKAKISAPGVDITSAWVGGGLLAKSGTSMACPHVAGVAALWWQKLTAEGLSGKASTISARLFATARRDVFAPGLDEGDVGQGFVTAPGQ